MRQPTIVFRREKRLEASVAPPHHAPRASQGRPRPYRASAATREVSDLSVDRPSRSFRQLAARPRAIKTGSNETPETALFSVQDYRHVCTYFRAPGVWLIARRENDCWGGTRRPSKPPRTTIFCLGAPRTPRRAPEPGCLDAERKPGTSRIQRRVELKFWPKLGQTGPENHFGTVSRYPARSLLYFPR